MSDRTAEPVPLLSVRDLKVAFRGDGGLREVLHGVSFDVMPGETVAIVGESGSGKSTTATAIVNLLPGTGKITNGSVTLEGRELTTLGRRDIESVRGRDIGFVPQDPMSSLNPVWSIGFQVKEAVVANGIAQGRAAAKRRTVEVLQQAGLADAERRLHQYPHQFSGGMRQRALIGIGLAADPKLLIADEPTSALDVSVRAQILNLLADLQREQGISFLHVSHDLAVIRLYSDRVAVMNRGRIVETGPSDEIFRSPQHPYTQSLVDATPEAELPPEARVPVRADADACDDLDHDSPNDHDAVVRLEPGTARDRKRTRGY